MPDETTTDEPILSCERWAGYFALGLLAAMLYRSAGTTPDPLDDLRQRVATLEGKVSR